MWYRRHRLSSTITRTSLLMMRTTKYGFVETFSPFEQIKRWKTKYLLLGTMVLVSQVVTYSCVSMFHFRRGPTVALQFLSSPTCQHLDKNIKNLHSLILGHFFSYISLHPLDSTVSNKVPTQVLIQLLFGWSNHLEKYNPCSFHSTSLVHIHLSSYVLYVRKEHEKKDTVDEV